MVQCLGVFLALLKDLLGSNTATDRPDIYREVAVVGHDGVANSASERSQRKSEGNERCREVHGIEINLLR